MVVIMGMNMKTMGIGFVKTFAKMFVVTLEGLIALIYSFLIFKVLYFIMSSVEVGSASDADSVVTTGTMAGVTAGGIMSAIMWLVFFFLLHPLTMFFMIELVVLQIKRSEVLWITFICFILVVCFQINAFALGLVMKGRCSFLFSFLAMALMWYRVRVERDAAKKIDVS